MKKCLIVIDYQNDFVTGTLGSENAQRIGENIASRIDDLRVKGWDIIFTYDTHGQEYLDTREGRHLPVTHCIRGTHGHALADAVDTHREQRDVVFEKGCFGSAEMFDYLRENPYDEIELAGVVTDICVITNAALAQTACPEAQLRVRADCTASADTKLHEAALAVMRSMQVDVIS